MKWMTMLLPLALAATAAAEDPVAMLRGELPADGELMASAKVKDLGTVFMEDGLGKARVVEDDTVPGGQALRVNVERAGENEWAAQVQLKLTGHVDEGDVLLMAFYVRAEEADNEAQSAVLPTNVVQDVSDYGPVVTVSTLAGEDWKLVYGSAVSDTTLPPGRAEVSLHLAATRQVVDVGPVIVLNLGPDVSLADLPTNTLDYAGREPDAPWRAEADARIDEHRRGDLAVTVTAGGEPVEGATVRIEQLRHAFHFGTMAGQEIAYPENEELREHFLKDFNYATLPVYWAWWGWESPDRRADYLEAMDWMNEQGVPWRAHTVIYPYVNNFPNGLKAISDDPEAVRRYTLDHVREVMAVLRDKGADCVDLVNEVRHHRDLMAMAGGSEVGGPGDELIDEAFRVAQEVAPDVTLFVNDFGILTGGGSNQGNIDYYHDWLDRAKANDVPVEGIGFQGHFGAGLTEPARVVEILDSFARHELPIHITEFDINVTDEVGQADYTRDLITAVYSHPSVEAFVGWGFWEGEMWKPDGAMYRTDWTPKPNHTAYRKLIFGDWWTDTTLATDAAGRAAERVHAGTYRVTVEHHGRSETREVEVTPEDATVEVSF